ncbi:Putative inner membrane protein YqgA [Salmonella enterica subsp. enterica]|uniref:Inner membrane protein YqgA n=1 Tax=Salmonella enterica I TaxID=59201 RepID=A0A447TVL1_SALET|nr:Putative inner membrane protein YqgA [Salmonella enterica subsp. enterica]
MLEKGINGAVAKIQQLFMASGKKPTHDSFIQSYVAIIVLFCASGTGIFGAMHEGMTGDPNILIAKSFSGFFHCHNFRLFRLASPFRRFAHRC